MTGSGDIAPAIPGPGNTAVGHEPIGFFLAGTVAGLIAVIVVATMFMTAEYRRGLIRTTLAVSPDRGRVLAAKAIVIGAAAFVTGLAAAAGTVIVATEMAHASGYSMFPVTWPTELRLIAGTAALVAVAAVLALAVGTIVRRSAAAVMIVIVTIVVPYFLAFTAAVPTAHRGVAAADHPGRRLRRPADPRRSTTRSKPPTRAAWVTASSRSRGGPGSRCCAAGPRSPWPWPPTCCAGGTHEPGAERGPAEPPGLAGDAARGVDQAADAGQHRLAAGRRRRAHRHGERGDGRGGAVAPGLDPAKLSLTGIQAGQAVVAILAVLVISNEYSTGMIRVTLTAMPRRHTVLAAKAALAGGLVLAAGAVAVLASVLAGRLILPGRGFTPANGYQLLSLGNGPDLRAACGSVLYLALIALLSLGVATAVRDSAVAIGTVLALLYLFPIVAAVVSNQHWQRHLEQIGPMTAGLYIQATVGVRALPLTPWQGLGVLALWAAGALILGGLVLRFRDA